MQHTRVLIQRVVQKRFFLVAPQPRMGGGGHRLVFLGFKPRFRLYPVIYQQYFHTWGLVLGNIQDFPALLPVVPI